MLSFTKNKSECMGCSACMAACPIDCITMHYDEEGFWYPQSSDACINCGKCERVCPLPKTDNTANHGQQKAFACLTKDDIIWRRSASGGAFSEICLAWGDSKTIVVGAAWDGLKVHHVCVEGVLNILSLCKSKYVASYPENTFREIKNYLKEGRKVIYCGVPCQVAGLNSFLNHSYDNLLTIDLICHGAGSPLVFDSAIHKMQKQFGEIIEEYEFRAKRNCYEQDHLNSITINQSKRYIVNDPYIQLFLKQNCLRPSCGEHCKFRVKNRQGDITIADFKGLINVFPKLLGTKRNYSTIVTNNAKGETLIPLLKNRMIVLECDVAEIGKYNPLFERQTWFSKDRDLFFSDFTKDKESALDKWTTDAIIFKPTIKNKVFNVLPAFLRKVAIKVFRNEC